MRSLAKQGDTPTYAYIPSEKQKQDDRSHAEGTSRWQRQIEAEVRRRDVHRSIPGLAIGRPPVDSAL